MATRRPQTPSRLLTNVRQARRFTDRYASTALHKAYPEASLDDPPTDFDDLLNQIK